MIITQSPVPPAVAQHAIVWIMNEWNDPIRRRTMRRECDDVMNPYAAHPACNRISGTYHEGSWSVPVSAQTMNSHQRVSVVVGVPGYKKAEPGHEKEKIADWLIKLPLKILIPKP